MTHIYKSRDGFWVRLEIDGFHINVSVDPILKFERNGYSLYYPGEQFHRVDIMTVVDLVAVEIGSVDYTEQWQVNHFIDLAKSGELSCLDLFEHADPSCWPIHGVRYMLFELELVFDDATGCLVHTMTGESISKDEVDMVDLHPCL